MARKTFTLEQIQAAIEGCGGFCIACGAEAESIEPDAERYRCDVCGENQVYGAEEILLMGLVQ